MTFTLLFDLDDTLLDTNIDGLIPVYFQKLAAHMAPYAAPEKFLRELVRATGLMYGNQDGSQTLRQVFGAHFYPALGAAEADWAGALEDFYDHTFPGLQTLTRPRPQAVELVDWAFSQGWRVIIATDPLFPRKAILHRLQWAGLPIEKYPFHLVTDFESFHFAKASVACFPEMLSRAGWNENSPLLMIGDSLERDILPAIKAGIPAFWLDPNGAAPAPEAEASPRGGLDDLRRFLETTDLSTLRADFSSPSAIIAALQAAPAVVHFITSQLAPASWNVRPGREDWSFTEMLCHLRDVDAEVNLPRLEQVLRDENAFISAQVTDPWAEERGYIHQDGPAAFAEFCAGRARLVGQLKSLDTSAWQKTARHTIFGPTTLRELIALAADHDRSHLRQAMNLL